MKSPPSTAKMAAVRWPASALATSRAVLPGAASPFATMAFKTVIWRW